jgi:aspartyl protease family protein
MTSVAFAAEPTVKVLGLFTNKALMLINGERKLLNKGEALQGVTLVSASGRGAVVRFDNGSQRTLTLNQSISHAFKKSTSSKHTIYADRSGMFRLNGEINGKPTRFLLDTGATYIAMSALEADRMGLVYENSKKSLIQTASTVVPVWNILLDNVRVGDIAVSQVEAVILQGSQPQPALLGMSFLQHVKLERNGAAMVLQQKY